VSFQRPAISAFEAARLGVWISIGPLLDDLVVNSSPEEGPMETFRKLFGSLLAFVGSEEARSVTLALAAVRRSNCPCDFLACSFHEDSFFPGRHGRDQLNEVHQSVLSL
jgi:hypothetical protein